MKTLLLSLAIVLAASATHAQKKKPLKHHHAHKVVKVVKAVKGKHPWQRLHTHGKAAQTAPTAQLRTEGTRLTLDSMVSAGQYKNVFSYDANGYVTLEIDYAWDSGTNQWVVTNKIQSAFDANGNETLEIDSYWDNGSNQWVGTNKYTDAFDANGNDTLSTVYNWDNATSQFVPVNQSESAYDANGNQTLNANYQWDGTAWVGGDKEVYAYDAKGDQTFYADYQWDSTSSRFVITDSEIDTYDAYGNYTRSIYTEYDPSGNTVDTTYYLNTLNANHKATTSIQYYTDGYYYYPYTQTLNYYDAYGNDTLSITSYDDGYDEVTQINQLNSNSITWDYSSANEYGYTATGKQTLQAYYNYNDTTGNWVGDTKHVNAYDANGNATLSADYEWDYNTNDWIETDNSVSTFDSYGDLTFYSESYLNDSTLQWVGESQSSFTFDTSVPASGLASPFNYAGSNFLNEVTSETDYTWMNGIWGSPVSYVFYYSNAVAGLAQNQIAGTTTLLYPNPCKDVLNIQGGASAYEVYTLSGTVVASNKDQTQTVDTSQLPAGVYFLKLNTAANSSMVKFVKE